MTTKEKNPRVQAMKKNQSLTMIAAVLFISLLSLLLTSCDNAPASQYTYQPPENIDDGLDIGTLAEVNIDPDLIGTAVDKIREGKYKEVHSMLIFKDNKLVFEEYFMGHRYKWDGPGNHGSWVTWNKYRPHNIMSDTKSITSACIGIAIDHGFIESVDQPIFDYLPEHQHLNKDGKDKITIEHLLTKTTGLEWKEWGTSYTNLENDTFKLWVECEDQITCILEKPLIDEPGTSFTYSGGGMVLLGEIIKHATNMNIEEFSEKYLFETLGIDPPVWEKYESGVIDASGGIKITPRDMTKFGAAFLNNGVWNGKQIIPEKWVEKSAATYPGNSRINVPGEDSGRVGYSYTWWTKQYSSSGKKINMYYAGGWGGQLIMVLPELNTVIVFTGGNYTTSRPDFKIFEKYVLPAIE
ncbi:MAG: beta-lactamase family protein [Anaerolineales bacterium]|nr:beta-lactamase family protein [Anaerolineales bacterium]